MADEVAIRIQNISKDFILPHEKVNSVKSLFTSAAKKRSGKQAGKETQHALHGISFEVKKGEFFGIVGRNGSGKSTLLKILAGIYQPTSGTTHIAGKLVPFIELGVGFNDELTGRENVYLNGALMGFTKAEIDAMYDDIVAFAELERFMDQKLKNYSSGMQVRLAFSMATRAESDILLVDEVLAVGDAAFQRKCFDYFQKLKGGDTTVVFISHNMDAVREYCDRAALIDNNRLVDIDNADLIAKQYSQLFLETTASVSKETKRWGNRAIAYDEVSAVVGKNKQDELVIKATATAAKDLDGMLIGFTIKNAARQALVGSNNLIEGQLIRSVREGQKFKVRWTVPNIFSDGRYTIDATLVQSNGQECDWWEEAAAVNIVSTAEHAPYLVSPPLKLNIETDGS